MRTFTFLLLSTFTGASACGTSPAAPPSAPAAVAPCPPDDEMCRVDRLGDTGFGWLKAGLSIADLEARIGPAEKVGETFEEGATGDVIHERVYTAAGVIVTAVRDAERGEVVRDYTVTPPFAEKSARGIGLGATEAAVLAAYADCLEGFSTVPGEKAVAGSTFGGMFFYFEGGVLTSIFVGAGAE